MGSKSWVQTSKNKWILVLNIRVKYVHFLPNGICFPRKWNLIVGSAASRQSNGAREIDFNLMFFSWNFPIIWNPLHTKITLLKLLYIFTGEKCINKVIVVENTCSSKVRLNICTDRCIGYVKWSAEFQLSIMVYLLIFPRKSTYCIRVWST